MRRQKKSRSAETSVCPNDAVRPFSCIFSLHLVDIAYIMAFYQLIDIKKSLYFDTKHKDLTDTSMGIRTPVFAVRGRRLRPLDHGGKTAELGFEPRMNESESLVLPLHHSASFTFHAAALATNE